MPPKIPQRRPARSRGYDPTVSIATASAAKQLTNNNPNGEQKNPDEFISQEAPVEKKQNDDLKKLIETLKNKMGSNATTPQKKAPPAPTAKSTWNRSVGQKEWTAKPAYTILTRVSDHEKVPVKATKQKELTINALPHSFLYRPGADGIKLDKISVKAGKQVCWG